MNAPLRLGTNETSPLYERPMIRRLQTGLTSKIGVSPFHACKVRREIDGVGIDDLVQGFGSPQFVFSEARIRRNMREARAAFSSRYPRVGFGWSYKTNYLDAVCAIFHQEGSLAEVVSGMEYEKACRLGVPGPQIIFNGPNKSPAALRRAAEDGAMIHVDHFDEIDDLEAVAAELGRTIPVGMRVNLDAGIRPVWSRFGFNLESGQAMDAARAIQRCGCLTLTGLHCHIGTFILDPEAYRTGVAKLVQLGNRLRSDLDVQIDYYDIGGGLPSPSHLKPAYAPPGTPVPPLDLYAERIAEGLYDNLPPGERPRLILESGRALIDDAGFLITTARAAKRLPDGRRAYVLDAGINLLYTSTWYRYDIALDRDVPGVPEPSLLNGPLCMNIDVVDEGTPLPPLPRGTRLILSPVGAYNVTQSMQFIEYRPAVTLVDETGVVHLIRATEGLDDLVHGERLPAHLTGQSA